MKNVLRHVPTTNAQTRLRYSADWSGHSLTVTFLVVQNDDMKQGKVKMQGDLYSFFIDKRRHVSIFNGPVGLNIIVPHNK